MTPTTDERLNHVARMRTNFAMEGMLPDATDLAWQIRYIDGDLTLNDMLVYARALAELSRSASAKSRPRIPDKL